MLLQLKSLRNYLTFLITDCLGYAIVAHDAMMLRMSRSSTVNLITQAAWQGAMHSSEGQLQPTSHFFKAMRLNNSVKQESISNFCYIRT